MKLLAIMCASVIFATVFDDCGNLSSRTTQPMTPLHPPSKPCCLTDPPEGCFANCATVTMSDMPLDVVSFTEACDGPGSGARALAFSTALREQADALDSKGLCGPEGVIITPCNLEVAPVELPNQDHDVCAPMTPGLCVTSW